MTTLCYAIDFGTSNSLLGAADSKNVYPLAPLDPFASDPTVMRSLIYFDPSNKEWFGEQSIQQFTHNSMSGRFLKSFKRFLPIQSFEGTIVNGRYCKLDDLIACFLREIRQRANEHFKQDVQKVVLGRPALFSEEPKLDQLAQTRLESAAKKAGFTSIEFLPEPVAAAYRYRLEMSKEEHVLVADFGGGTSDYTILKLSKSDFKPEDVLAIGGAPIAGDALDGSLMKNKVSKNLGADVQYKAPFGSNILTMPKGMMSYLCSTSYINLLNSRENKDFLNRVEAWSLGPDDHKSMEQLKVLLENQLGFSVFESIEKAKRDLSEMESTHVSFHYPGLDIEDPLSQQEFKNFSEPEIRKIFHALDETLKKAGLNANQIDRVCATGGTAKALLIREGLLQRFDSSKIENFRNFTSIVEGLSERARQITR